MVQQLLRESGRSPPPPPHFSSSSSSSSFSTLAITVFPEAKAAPPPSARAMADRKNLFATFAALTRREATFYDPPSFSFSHLPREFNTQFFGVCAPARLLNALFLPRPSLSLSWGKGRKLPLYLFPHIFRGSGARSFVFLRSNLWHNSSSSKLAINTAFVGGSQRGTVEWGRRLSGKCR